jgi:hypothetical protein
MTLFGSFLSDSRWDSVCFVGAVSVLLLFCRKMQGKEMFLYISAVVLQERDLSEKVVRFGETWIISYDPGTKLHLQLKSPESQKPKHDCQN